MAAGGTIRSTNTITPTERATLSVCWQSVGKAPNNDLPVGIFPEELNALMARHLGMPKSFSASRKHNLQSARCNCPSFDGSQREISPKSAGLGHHWNHPSRIVAIGGGRSCTPSLSTQCIHRGEVHQHEPLGRRPAIEPPPTVAAITGALIKFADFVSSGHLGCFPSARLLSMWVGPFTLRRQAAGAASKI